MKHICITCNYSTNDHSNWYKHIKSKKHISVNLDKDNFHVCAYCKNKFSTTSSLGRHIKTCQYRKINENAQLNKIHEIEKENYEDKVEKLEKQVDYLKDFVYGAGNLLNKSMSNIGYLNLHYNQAKPLEKHSSGIRDLKINKDESLFSVITYYQRDNSLHKFIGDFIISLYKKDDPKEQSLWTTDCSRLNYLVRTAIKKKNIWKIDKAGMIVKENIINPILFEIFSVLSKEIERSAKDYINLKYQKIKELVILQQVVTNIESKKLEHDINKYIAPHFDISRMLPTDLITYDDPSDESCNMQKELASNTENLIEDYNYIVNE
jgi:prolyl oligopeptidase PreP (S9A serine peptidase family)